MSITVRTQGKPTWPPTARRGLASRELAQARHGASTVPRSEGAPRRHGPGPEQLSNGPAGPAPTARPRTPETERLHGRGGSVRQKLRGCCIKPRREEPTDPRLAARTQAPARPGPGFDRCGLVRWTMPQAVKGSRPLRAFTASPKGSHSRSGTDTLRPLGPTTSPSPALGHRNGERGQPVAPSFSPPAARWPGHGLQPRRPGELAPAEHCGLRQTGPQTQGPEVTATQPDTGPGSPQNLHDTVPRRPGVAGKPGSPVRPKDRSLLVLGVRGEAAKARVCVVQSETWVCVQAV